ncbi:MAG: hypothetical protein AAGF02_14640 [Actinomycetota bacterium]
MGAWRVALRWCSLLAALAAVAIGCSADPPSGEAVETLTEIDTESTATARDPEARPAVTHPVGPEAIRDEVRWACDGFGAFTLDELESPPQQLDIDELGIPAESFVAGGDGSAASDLEIWLADQPVERWFSVGAPEGSRVFLNRTVSIEINSWSYVALTDDELAGSGSCELERATEPGVTLASWAPLGIVEEQATSFVVTISEPDCDGRIDGDRVRDPEIVLAPESITITFRVDEPTDPERPCEREWPLQVLVELDEPVGERVLLDGAFARSAPVGEVADLSVNVATLAELPLPAERSDGRLMAPWITTPVFGAPNHLYVQVRRCVDQQLLEPEIAYDADQVTIGFPVTPSEDGCDDVLPTDVLLQLDRDAAGLQLFDGASVSPRAVASPPEFLGELPRPPAPTPTGDAVGIAGELVVTGIPLPSCTASYSAVPGLSSFGWGVLVEGVASGLDAVISAAGLPEEGWLSVSFPEQETDSTFVATLGGEVVASVTLSGADAGAWLIDTRVCAGLEPGWRPDADPSVLDAFVLRTVDLAEVDALLADFPDLEQVVDAVLAADPARVEVEVEVPLDLRCDVATGIEALLSAEGFTVSALETAELERTDRSVRFMAAVEGSRLVTVSMGWSSPTVVVTYDHDISPDQVPFSGEPPRPFPCSVEGPPGS